MANEIAGLSQPALPTQAGPVANASVGGPGPQPQQSPQTSPPATDTVTLTDSARLLQRLEAAVAQAPHLNGQRIDQIKQQIASGAYHVDPQQVAAQFSQFESDLSGQQQVHGSRTDNGYTYSVSTTNARGTRERNVTVGYDASTGTLARDVSLTGAHGDEISRHGEIQVTDNGYVKSRTVTGRDGESVSRQVAVSYDAESKSLTRAVTVDGENRDYTRTTQIARTENGDLMHKTVTRPTDHSIT
jgi:negative regulator of flagellin synthesis FlgM